MQFYHSPDVVSVETYGLTDAHPVCGGLTSDGGYLMAGKAMESENDWSNTRSFAVRLMQSGAIAWVWASPPNGTDDAANAVLQLPNDGDVIVVGFRSVAGIFQRSITKIAFSDGTEIFTASWPATNAARHGAWENAELTKDGTAVILAGLTNAADNSNWQFKSCTNRPGIERICCVHPPHRVH